MFMYCGFILSYLEKSFDSNFTAAWDKSSKENNFWLTVITMTTVGYGDGYPSTHLGRFIMIMWCIYGRFVLSLVINKLSNAITLNVYEQRAYDLITKSKILSQNKLGPNKSAKGMKRQSTMSHNKHLSIFKDLEHDKQYIMSYKDYFAGLNSKIVNDCTKMRAQYGINLDTVSAHMNDLKAKMFQSNIDEKLQNIKNMIKNIKDCKENISYSNIMEKEQMLIRKKAKLFSNKRFSTIQK